jgi:hypothetical protein
MINVKDIRKIINDLKGLGHDITVRDISYAILLNNFENGVVAYKSIYNENAEDIEADKFEKSLKIFALRSYLKSNVLKKEKSPKKEKIDINALSSDITFEENKAALIAMLGEIQQAIQEKKIDLKDGLKMQTDIRIKINDKFGVSEQTEQQYIIVEPKFNFICPHTRKECYVYTKEDLMKKYNLIEGPKNND